MYFDQAENRQVVIQRLDKLLEQINIKNQVIFYSNKGVNEKQLSDFVYKLSESLPQRRFIIDEDHFFKYFKRPTCIYDFMRSKYFRYKITRKKAERKLRIQKVEQNINKNKTKQRNNLIANEKLMYQIHCENLKQQMQQEKNQNQEATNDEFQQQIKNQKEKEKQIINAIKHIQQSQVFCRLQDSVNKNQEVAITKPNQDIVLIIKTKNEVNNLNNPQRKFNQQHEKLDKLFKEIQIFLEQQVKMEIQMLRQLKHKYQQSQQDVTLTMFVMSKICQKQFIESMNSQKKNNNEKKRKKEELIRELQQVSKKLQQPQIQQDTVNLEFDSLLNNQNQLQKTQQPKNKYKPLGCGQFMNFQILSRLSNIEQILIKWYQVKTFEQVIKQVTLQQKLREKKKQMQMQVRSKLKNIVNFCHINQFKRKNVDFI